MKLVESADGTIRVMELDPTKWYWLILDHAAVDELTLDQLRRAGRRDGMIIVKRQGRSFFVIESPDRVEAVVQDTTVVMFDAPTEKIPLDKPLTEC